MTARMLQTTASALSAYTCMKLFEKLPDLKSEGGDDAFDYWKGFVGQLIGNLAVAVKEDKPELFRNKIQWERKAFQSRNVDDQSIAVVLACLIEVINEELAEPSCELPATILANSQQEFEQSVHESPAMEANDPVSNLAAKYLLGILEGDTHDAIRLVVDSYKNGMNLEDVYVALVRAQSEVGRMWHVAEVMIAEEHLVTHTTHRAMSVLNFIADRAEPNGKTIVSSSVEGNYHDLGIRAVTDFFEFNGWRVICLGNDTPAKEIAEAAKVFDASLVMLSASMSTHLDATRRTIALVKEKCPDCKLLLGGRIFEEFPDLASEIGGDGRAKLPSEAVQLGNQLCP